MISTIRHLFARWSAWRALDDHSSAAPRAHADINRLDALLRESSCEEASRPAHLRRAVMPALSRPAPASIAAPFPWHSILTAITCAAAIALVTWIGFAGPLGLFKHSHGTYDPSPSNPGRITSPLAMLSFSRISGTIEDPLQQEAKLIAADFTRAADFLRAQIPLARTVAPRQPNGPS
ncbi:MAG TPA: hypothetical protein VG797_08875 [Phycisphaerales bacterium]|nr:hypothetical protein [Phycisphaerales bacterium]